MTGLAVGASPAPRRLGLELVLFAALAAFGLAQWARLFAAPPVVDLLAALAIGCAGGTALALLGRSGLDSTRRTLAAAAIALATVIAALGVVGLPLRLLGPANWGELGANLGDGLAGVEDTELPYGGDKVWLRLTLMLGAAALIALGAVLAFWPGLRRSRARALSVIVLIAIYGLAVTLDSPGSERVWGIGLLLLAAAWLWLPEVELPRGLIGLALVLAAGVAALPLAARIDTTQPWWNYENWDFFADERTVTYNWDHSYGPLDWPQRGTTVLEVASAVPLYWKASVLDRFDGFTWQRATRADALGSGEIAARRIGPSVAELAEQNPEWRLRATFEVRGLRSGLVIGTGTPLAIEGNDLALPTADGTVLAGDEPLERDDSYSIEAYAPQPSPRRLRSAPQAYPGAGYANATLVGMPAFDTDGSSGFAPGPSVRVPTWGEPAGLAADEIRASAYGSIYDLATRLTAGAPTAYDAVRRVEQHLQENYDYSPNVGNATYPLQTFLLAEQSGYCQHFAGSMALMLRMVGIPSRVVSGFAPGRYESDLAAYQVRDTDAHSWVEVYFRDIGWVTFDPTPSAAPAAAQTLDSGGALILRRDGSTTDRGDLRSIETALEGGTVAGVDGSGSRFWGVAGILAVVIAALGGIVAAARFAAGRRRLGSPRGPELQARELTDALGRLGWSLDARPTLFGIERRFAGAGRPVVSGYAGALRRHRFGPPAADPPPASERRRLRRALGAGGGLGRRWRAWRALPPGGPRGGV